MPRGAVKDAKGKGGGGGWNKGTSRMLPFAVARAIVQKLKLKGDKEWREWSKSGQRPSTSQRNVESECGEMRPETCKRRCSSSRDLADC